MGWVVNTTHRPLYLRERPGTHYIGGWVGLRDVLDRCEKTRPYRDPIPGPSNPYRVAILTELSRPKLGSQYLQNSMFYSCEIIYIF